MTIKEVCEQLGISADTLRYYERVGVIPEVSRTTGGKRDYQQEDINWIENAICMRSAGMPIESIIEYVRLFQLGDETIPARMELLTDELKQLLQQKAQLEKAINRLQYKVERYKIAVETGTLSWKDDTSKCAVT